MLRLFLSKRPRARLMLSIAGIALGVALGYGVHLVNRAAVDDVAAAVRFFLETPSVTGQMIATDSGQHLLPGGPPEPQP